MSKPTPLSRIVPIESSDPEIQAISICVQVLDELTPEAAYRIAEFLRAKYGTKIMAAPEPFPDSLRMATRT